MRILLALFVLLAVTSCVAPAPKARPVAPSHVAPPPSPPPRAIAPLPADWRDWPLVPGTWRYERRRGDALSGATTSAAFTDAGKMLVQVTCDLGKRQVEIIGPADGAARLRTSDLSRTVTFTPPFREPPSWPSATFAATDPILDAIAFSRGRWTIEQPGRPPLVLPAWAEVARVVEDCRN